MDCGKCGATDMATCDSCPGGYREKSESSLNDLLSTPDLIYQAARDKWGVEPQIDMLVEECAELIAETNRFRRKRVDISSWLEELADVEIMIEQMRVIFSSEVIDKIKRKKLTRLAERTGLFSVTFGKLTWQLTGPPLNFNRSRNLTGSRGAFCYAKINSHTALRGRHICGTSA